MVVGYLEKIKNRFLEDKMEIDERMVELAVQHKENVAFVQLLEKERDEAFEAFTPRTVNSHHRKKLEEIREKQKMIEEEMDALEAGLKNVEKELEEVERVIKVAKRKIK